LGLAGADEALAIAAAVSERKTLDRQNPVWRAGRNCEDGIFLDPTP